MAYPDTGAFRQNNTDSAKAALRRAMGTAAPVDAPVYGPKVSVPYSAEELARMPVPKRGMVPYTPAPTPNAVPVGGPTQFSNSRALAVIPSEGATASAPDAAKQAKFRAGADIPRGGFAQGVESKARGVWNGVKSTARVVASPIDEGIKPLAKGAWNSAARVANADVGAIARRGAGYGKNVLMSPVGKGGFASAPVVGGALSFAFDSNDARNRAKAGLTGVEGAVAQAGNYAATGMLGGGSSAQDVAGISRAIGGDGGAAYMAVPKEQRGFGRKMAEWIAPSEGQAASDKLLDAQSANARVQSKLQDRLVKDGVDKAFDGLTQSSESKSDSLPRRTSAANERLEQIRQRYAAQAPGIGSVDLGAGNLNTDGFGNATNQTGMVGGGMKRNSLASSIGKFGEPVYDNDSIARMMARDAGKGGWNAKNLDRVEEATRITNRNAGGEGYYAAPQGPTAVGAAAARGEGGASARRSAGGGTGGIDGYGGDNGSFRQPRFPQAQITQGNLMGANSERKAGIENLDAAIKSLTTENGGLNMRSKRSLYGDLLRQRAEMSGKPYEVENARDMKGADQANEMARANADRALEQDKFGFEREKYATDRSDAAAAAYAKANGPLSAEDQLKNLELEEKIASKRAGFNGAMNADDRGYLKDLTAELMKDGKMSAEDARAQASEKLVDERINSDQKLDNQTLLSAGKTRLDKINDVVNSDRGWWKGAWQGDIAGNDVKIDLNSYDPDQINIQKQPWNASPQSALNKLNPFTAPLYEAVGPMQKSDSGAEQRYKRVISGEKEASEFQKQLNRAAATRRAMRRDDK